MAIIDLDITHEHCPMTLVKTKLALSRLSHGDILSVTLKEGEPLNNIPRAVEEQGFRVLSITKTPEKEIYRVDITLKSQMKIFGITGTLGAGKGTVVEYMIERYHFRHYSVRAYLLENIRQRNLPENRDSMVIVANDLREKYGNSFIVDELYKTALAHHCPAIIESIRTPGEIDSLKNKGNFILLSVDAPPETRYQRILCRQSETDRVSYQDFLENEKREMHSDNPAKQNLAACIARADFSFYNSADKETLYKEIDKMMQAMTN
ncbi:MAG: sulfurtransferase TusA family protein [Bacteroidales bacterium]|jgi:dephospho-CoA kinase/TusA-related sulfurtransferase|nr:sulfurtransferase TusA family protein [Bacteroidales bacterium]